MIGAIASSAAWRDNPLLERAAKAGYEECVALYTTAHPLPPHLIGLAHSLSWDELHTPVREHWRAITIAMAGSLNRPL